MSDLTSFEIRVAAEKLAAFGAELAALVEPGGCSKVCGGVDTPAQVVVGVLREMASGAKAEECLTLAFPADPMLREFQAENPELLSSHPGNVAVGCFWLTCTRAESEYVVAFTSATRSISSLMKESGSVQSAFRALAKDAVDGRVWVTNAWHEVSEL